MKSTQILQDGQEIQLEGYDCLCYLNLERTVRVNPADEAFGKTIIVSLFHENMAEELETVQDHFTIEVVTIDSHGAIDIEVEHDLPPGSMGQKMMDILESLT